jgi:HEAT repeat protein
VKVHFSCALVVALSGSPAWALVWPDVVDRVTHDLTSADVSTRRAAARELGALGVTQGAPLAIEALGDSDTEVRLAAADAALHLRAPGATNAVTSWLNAPDPRLRRKACDLARVLPTPQAVAPLARSLGDSDPDVRLAAAEALGYQASGDAVPPLLGRLDDPAPAVRVQIVAALARLGDVRAVVPLVGKVQDSSPDVREAVVRALGDLGDKRASSALVLALRDQNNDVRRDALAALGRMRAADAVDAVAPFAADRASALRLAAIEALGHIASADAIRVLAGELGAGDDASGSVDRTPVREALVAAGPAAVPALHSLLLRSPSAAATAGAAWVLGELHATEEAVAIVDAMRRGTLSAAAALHALAGAGTAAQVPVVLEFVTDAGSIVRSEALRAADALLDPKRPDGRAVEPLAAALRDARASPSERSRIAMLLGRTGAQRAAPLLVDLARGGDPALRLAAIDAMGMLRSGTLPAPQSRHGDMPSDPLLAPDEALLDAIGSRDPVVRLHAAIALSEAGGEHARDGLLARLDGGDAVDRGAVLEALGGILERVPSEPAIAKLVSALDLAAGPERDAIVEAIGRAPGASSTEALRAIARSTEPADRMAAATMLAAHPGDPMALASVRGLLGDSSSAVRAQAAWALGSVGDASDLARLEAVARDAVSQDKTTLHDFPFDGLDAIVNAAASIGRIAARTHTPGAASRGLCPLLISAASYVRANALAGLALAAARCEDGLRERTLLVSDPSADVRASAALLLSRSSNVEDERALLRCVRGDPSVAVARHCGGAAAAPLRVRAVLVYVLADGASSPRPGSAYAVLLADGTLRAGTTDRRGAVFEPAAPEGDIALRKPSALAK